MKYQLAYLCILAFIFEAIGQGPEEPVAFPYSTIYAYGLDANIRPALSLMQHNSYALTREDREFIDAFRKRFGGPEDRSDYLAGRSSEIDDLLLLFRDYWRLSLLDPDTPYEGQLAQRVVSYLMKDYPAIRGQQVNRDNVGLYLSAYIKSLGLYTMDKIDYQGRLIDLVVWKNQTEKMYNVALNKENLEVKVVFMQDFISLGWNEYATLGAHYPGGWTESDALYCVRQAYDLSSEEFKVSFLAHEARHFLDKKEFPKLSQPDLEYRAKLTELSMARETVHDLIKFYLQNAGYDAKNGHPIANYFVMENLSDIIFNCDGIEQDLEKWNQIKYKKINKKASLLLEANTKNLRAIGSDVQTYLKTP